MNFKTEDKQTIFKLRDWLNTNWFVVIYAFVYFAFAELAHALSFPGNIATFWPPSGLSLAVLLLADKRRWPALLLAGASASFTSSAFFHDRPLLVALGYCLAGTVKSFLSAYVLRWLKVPESLHTVKDLITLYVTGAIVMPMVGAAIGATVAALAFGDNFGSSWLKWWLSDAIGVVVFSPAILVLLGGTNRIVSRINVPLAFEAALLLIGMVVDVELVCSDGDHSLIWTILPFMLWAAYRFEETGVAIATLVVANFLAYKTSHGHGPFAGDWTPLEQMILCRAFVLVNVVTYWSLALSTKEHRANELRLADKEKRLRELYDGMDEHIFSTGPGGKFLEANKACLRALGYTREEFLSMSVAQVVHPDDLIECGTNMQRQMDGERLHVKSRVVTKSGDVRYVEGSTEYVFENGKHVGSRSIFHDVTDRKLWEETLEICRTELEQANSRLHALADTDGLTGVHNRRAFDARLQHELAQYHRNHLPLSVMMIDVDHFKMFNDSFGHKEGDEVLQVVGKILSDLIRDTDFVARYGGEEFVIILPNTDDIGSVLAAERVRSAIETWEWKLRPITISVGVSTLNSRADDKEDLVRFADAALYQSKLGSRNMVTHSHIFAPGILAEDGILFSSSNPFMSLK